MGLLARILNPDGEVALDSVDLVLKLADLLERHAPRLLDSVLGIQLDLQDQAVPALRPNGTHGNIADRALSHRGGHVTVTFQFSLHMSGWQKYCVFRQIRLQRKFSFFRCQFLMFSYPI
jgi:hypothetical protein